MQDTIDQKKEAGFAEAPLEQSIWLLSNRSYNNKATYAAKIPAYNVPDSSQEERIKFVRRLLAFNKYVKEVKEVFKRRNAWVIAIFDCKYGKEKTKK